LQNNKSRKERGNVKLETFTLPLTTKSNLTKFEADTMLSHPKHALNPRQSSSAKHFVQPHNFMRKIK